MPSAGEDEGPLDPSRVRPRDPLLRFTQTKYKLICSYRNVGASFRAAFLFVWFWFCLEVPKMGTVQISLNW